MAMTTRTVSGLAVTRSVVLLAALAFFLTPLIAAASFGFSLPGEGLTLAPLQSAVQDISFLPQIVVTLQLAFLTTLLSTLIMLPTLIFLHIKSPRLLGVAESVAVLPYVVPAVALVSGANLFFRAAFPPFLVSVYSLVPFYVILTMPLVFRALDTGIRALDVRTLFETGTSLGAGWMRVVFSLILPNMRIALLSAGLLSVAFVFTEFALANLLLHNTFPVFIVSVGQNRPQSAAALSVVTILGTWLLMQILSTAGRSRSREDRVPEDATPQGNQQ